MKPNLIEKKPGRSGVNNKVATKCDNKCQPVEVFCRLRPVKNAGDCQVIRATSTETLLITGDNNQHNQTYKFKHIFDDKCTQKDVFNKIAFPLVKDWFHGENGLLFTYGVTSSGKTYTVTGKPENPGLLPRILDLAFNSLKKTELFSKKNIFRSDDKNGFIIESTPEIMFQQSNDLYYNRKNGSSSSSTSIKNFEDSLLNDWKDRERECDFIKDINHDYNYSIFVSYVENYNKYIYDLLDDKPFDQPQQQQQQQHYPLRNGFTKPQAQKILRESCKKQVYVQGLTEIEVRSSEEAFALFLKGNLRRKIGSTNMNADSSRSHSIFTLRLVQAPLNINGTELINDPSMIGITQLSIVDLAGCERIQRTGATGNRLKEASNINNSLLTLRSCFEALRENQKQPKCKKLVPYRDSRLTLLFKSFFEGGGQVKMIICLNPGSQDFDETLNVLKFGELSQDVMTKNTDILFSINGGGGSGGGVCSEHKFASLSFTPWPEKWIDSPDDNRIMDEWRTINELRNNERETILSTYQIEMKNIRDAIHKLATDTVIYREENERLKIDSENKNDEYQRLQDQFIVAQRDKEKSDKAFHAAQKNADELKQKLSRIENENSKYRNDYVRLKDNIELFFESHRNETRRIVDRMLKNKEERLREMECINKKKLELAAKILENDDDDELLQNMRNLSAEKIWSSIYEKQFVARKKMRPTIGSGSSGNGGGGGCNSSTNGGGIVKNRVLELQLENSGSL